MADPIQPWPLTKKGDAEHPVRTLQQLLRAHKQTAVAVDGRFGPKTETAVKAVQKAKKLTVDGIVGPKTWAAIVITVKKGSKGDAVRGVQEEIAFRNLSDDPGPPIDGIFGPKTDGFIRGFQEALEITVDGIVGPVTWRALVSGMLSF